VDLTTTQFAEPRLVALMTFDSTRWRSQAISPVCSASSPACICQIVPSCVTYHLQPCCVGCTSVIVEVSPVPTARCDDAANRVDVWRAFPSLQHIRSRPTNGYQHSRRGSANEIRYSQARTGIHLLLVTFLGTNLGNASDVAQGDHIIIRQGLHHDLAASQKQPRVF
jgi:hypothetical protein